MRRMLTRRNVVVGAVILGLGGIAADVAGGMGGDDDATDRPITGPALEAASAAALSHVGGGRVTGTEVGDEESLYEVEVTRDDGTHVDVQVDAGFDVVGTKDDGPAANDD